MKSELRSRERSEKRLLSTVLRVHVDTAITRFALIGAWTCGLLSIGLAFEGALWFVWTFCLASLMTLSQSGHARTEETSADAPWQKRQQFLKLVYAASWAIPPALALWSTHPMGPEVGLSMIFGGMLVLVANYGGMPRRLLMESLVYIALLAAFLVTHLHTEMALPALAIALLLIVVCLDSSEVMRETGQHLLEIQDKLEAAKERAEEVNRSRVAFIADLNHEIRTPLNGVLGLASAMGQTRLNPDQREMVSLIETSGETLERLLSDLIDLSSIAEGRFELKPAPINMRETVSKAAELMRSRAIAKGLDFDVTYGPYIDDWFEGDSIRIRQIISNLTSNAVKFTTEGFIRVSVMLSPDASDDTYASLAISVEDSGIGFDGETHRRLFQRFQQGKTQTESEVRGAGLGLTISRALAERMNGQLAAISAPGQGSIFTLTLKLKRTNAPKPTPVSPHVLSQSAGGDTARAAMNILLAEDHPVNQRVIQQILTPLSPRLTMVTNGDDAVRAFEDGVFDLILMDMQMDGLDGITATERIRSRERRTRQQRTPILILSAHSSDTHVQNATAAGADGFLSKPLTAEGLLSRINGMVGNLPPN